MKRLYIDIVLIVLVGLVIAWIVRTHHKDPATEKLQQLCIGAQDAMRQDEAAFEGSDAAARERAYERFYEGDAIYHSAQSLLYCVDSLPEMPARCQLDKDWACLARIAHQIRQALEQR